jgi:hypothetical protein
VSRSNFHQRVGNILGDFRFMDVAANDGDMTVGRKLICQFFDRDVKVGFFPTALAKSTEATSALMPNSSQIFFTLFAAINELPIPLPQTVLITNIMTTPFVFG